MDHRQKDWPEWLALAEFVVNNKVYMATKVSLFMANYGKELRMEGNIRRKEKVEKTTKFVEKLKRVQEEAMAALKRMQEEMKKYANRNRKKTEEWKKRDRIILSTKDLVFKERPVCKFVKIEESGLDLFLFSFFIFFLFDLFFYFLFLEQLGLGLIGHAITSIT